MGNKTKWVLDPTHSELLFKVKHLMITNVKGEFRNFEGTIITQGEGFNQAKVEATVQSDSVFTNNEDRDKHLKSADFFDVENHANLHFVGTSFDQVEGDEYLLSGELTIRGNTNPIKLKVEFGGVAVDPWGNKKAGFSLSGKINRKDWGLNWNAALEAGGVLVSDEVKINAELQFVVEEA